MDLRSSESPGVVAVGDRVGNAEIRVVCGDYHPTRNAGQRTVSIGVDEGDAVGSYEITIADRAYADDCRQHGVRVQADFRLESDGTENRKLFSGIAGADGNAEQMTLNINPFTDIAVRTALTDTDLTADNAWMSAQPSADEWQAMAANLKRIAELTASSVDFAAGAFRPTDGRRAGALSGHAFARLERRHLWRGAVGWLAGRCAAAGQCRSTCGQKTASFALRRRPLNATRLAAYRQRAARIELAEYDLRIVDNLAQFDDEVAAQTDTVEFIAITNGQRRTLSLTDLGFGGDEPAGWRVHSAEGAGIDVFAIGDEEVELDIARGARGERSFKVTFAAIGRGLVERFYTIVLLAEPEIAPIEIPAREQEETSFIPQIADPDRLINSYALRGAPAFITVDVTSGRLRIAPDYGAVPTGSNKNYTFALLANGDDSAIVTLVVVSVANTQAPLDTQSPITSTIVGAEDTPRILLRHELIETSNGAVWKIVGATAEAGSALRVAHSEDRITVTSPNAVGTQGFSVMFQSDALTIKYDYVFEARQRDDVHIAPIERAVSAGALTEIPIAVTDPDGELTGGETATLQGHPDYVQLDWPNRKLVVNPDSTTHGSSRFILNIDYGGQHVESEINLTVVDDAPPAEVSELSVVAGERSAALRWRDPDDADLASIKIEPIGGGAPVTVAAGQGEYKFSCLGAAVSGMRISTVNSNGVESAGVLRSITFVTDDFVHRDGATVLAMGNTACGNVAYENDRDWYKTELTGGRLYRIDMNKKSGSRVDPIVRLFPNPGSNKFVADNNGANPGRPLSDARLYYRATRSGFHDIQVTTGTADRDVNNVDYIGDYSLSIREVATAPVVTTPTPILESESLTRDIADYELVWSDEFDGPSLDENIWGPSPYFPGISNPGGIRTDIDENGVRRSRGWDINLEPTLRFVSHDGLQVLRQAITYPRYSGLAGRPGWNIDDDGNWRILRPGVPPLIISDGYLPVLRGTDYSIKPDLSNIVSSNKGFWGSRVSTRNKIHTRYGYYELYVRYKEFTNFQGFRFAWWIDGQNRGATSDNQSDSLKNSVYNGQEIDIAEVLSLNGPIVNGKYTETRLLNAMRVHIFSTSNVDHYVKHYRRKDINIDNAADQRRWWRIGVEWTPTDICFYRDGRKDSCISDTCSSCQDKFRNTSGIEIRDSRNPIVTNRPEYIQLTMIIGGWRGENIIPDHHERMKNGLEAVAYVDYMRIYKPRDRYGDWQPDNHLIGFDGNTVNSEADLSVRR